MRNVKKFGKMMAAGLLCFAMAITAMPATAATTYDPVPGPEIKIPKYLVMSADANVPNYTPTFTIVKGQGFKENGTPVVYDGIGEPSITNPEFKVGDTKENVPDDSPNIELGKTYARKDITIDFSKIEFPEPGVYRYNLTENEAPAGYAITNDSQPSRTLDVYVTYDDEEEALKIGGYVLYLTPEGQTTAFPEDYENIKPDGFTNKYTTHNLSFSKTVTGNQGSLNKWFKVTLKITGATKNTKYDVNLSLAEHTTGTTVNSATNPEYAGMTNPESFITDEYGNATQDFYLQSGDKITVNGLADGTKYTLTEVEEDYTPSVVIEGSDGDIDIDEEKNGVADMGSGIKADTNVKFTNEKEGEVPTGVLMSVAPYVIIGGIVLAGIIALSLRKRRG